MNAQTDEVALPLRPHTILGVCEAIGEDFGFNPTFLRIPLAVSVIWNLPIALATYAGLGLVVLASRLLFPKQKQPVAISNDKAEAEEQQELAKAA
jgi:phage shock protein PspC (stress-responsive transcriptional regulator)